MAAQKLEGLHTLTYREQLKVLGLELLEERRLRADLTFAYKLLLGYTALDARECVTILLCVTMLTMLLLEVTRRSCCYHDLPLHVNILS